MKLIVGLGNPGDEYAGTRHNIGRRLLEFVAARQNAKFALKKSQKAAATLTSWNSRSVCLAYPLTYMNLSGEAVAALVKHCKIEAAKDLLIAVDDVALPFGRLRLRNEGSSGGHNGLASIEEHLRSREYSRLRIGIGPCSKDPLAGSVRPGEPLRDYVLSAFHSAEEKKMASFLERGAEACLAWLTEPLAKAMSRVNASVL